MRSAVTLIAGEPLACRLAMIQWTALSDDDLAQMARVTSARVATVGANRYELHFVEPLELVVAAQQLVVPFTEDNARRCGVRGFTASPLAVELLRDAQEPTRSAWQWLLNQLEIAEPTDGVVAAVTAGAIARTAIDPPMIAVQYPAAPYGDERTTRLFDQDQVIVGRGERTAHIAIRDGNVSRKHCAFLRRAGAWYLKDLGSSGGTDYMGRNVIGGQRVKTGDVFRICDYDLEVVAIL
jgi:hypothetical protein